MSANWWSIPIRELLDMLQEVHQGANPGLVLMEAYANGINERDGDGSCGYLVISRDEMAQLLDRAVLEHPDALLQECLSS